MELRSRRWESELKHSTQPYFFKRPSRLLALWILVLVVMAGLLIIQVRHSHLFEALLKPLI